MKQRSRICFIVLLYIEMCMLLKKYIFIFISILILFFIVRVYLQSEHVKAAYYNQKLRAQEQNLEKEKIQLIASLHALQSSAFIKKNVNDKLNLEPINLKQVHSLSKKKEDNE